MPESNLDADAKCRDRWASRVERTHILEKGLLHLHDSYPLFNWLHLRSHGHQEIRTSFSLRHPMTLPKYYSYIIIDVP